jgi:hypothetical protein
MLVKYWREKNNRNKNEFKKNGDLYSVYPTKNNSLKP